MSASTDENERRKCSMEHGKEMLKKYKMDRLNKPENVLCSHTDAFSDEESVHNEKSIDFRGSSTNEGLSSRDITRSSISMSEGEGDGDLEGMAGRVAELEEMLQGKEAIVEALSTEIDFLRGEAPSPNSSQSQSSSIHGREIISLYHTKLEEYEIAIKQRDNLIEDMTSSLQQALSSRDALVAQLNALNSMQPPELNVSNVNLAEKDLVQNHESEITNIQIKYEECLKLLKDENKVLADRLNKELADLESKHAKELSVFQMQLAHYKKTIKTLKLELVNRTESQKTAVAQVSMYKSEAEEMRVQSENSRRLQELNYQKEKEMLNEQIKLHKIQLEEITAKHLASTALLESKESIEHSLQQALINAGSLKDENNILRFKLEDLSARYSAAQSSLESNQVHERSMGTRIQDLEKSLSRLSGINVSVLSELNNTTYQTFDEFAIQYQSTRQKLDEKQEMEKLLVEKIRGLEEDVGKAREELERTNLTKKSYEKQLKDMKNLCDKLRSEINTLNDNSKTAVCSTCRTTLLSLSDQNKFSEQDKRDMVADFRKKIDQGRQEVEALKESVEQKDLEISNYIKVVQELEKKTLKAERECAQLQNGLAAAWAQCAEVEEKLSQTLAMGDSTIDISSPPSAYNNSLCKCLTNNTVDNNVAYDTVEAGNESEANTSGSANMREKRSLMDASFSTKKCTKMVKEMEHLLGKQPSFDTVLQKLYHNVAVCEKLTLEKSRLMQEHVTLKTSQKDANLLEQLVEQLKADKRELEQQMGKLIEQHGIELSAVRAESAMEIKKIQSFLLSSNKDFTEIRHAQETEELEMEKQNTEEVLNQQSKKKGLDDDDKIDKLSKGAHFVGAGDGVVLSLEGDVINTKSYIDEQSKTTSAYRIRINSLLEELERKNLEIADVNLKCDKQLEDQKKMYENYRKDLNDKTTHTVFQTIDQHCQTEWDVDALENCELLKLRAAYRHQLDEQVAQARLDIVHELQEQIQTILPLEEGGEENWPPELIQLRDKLTSNAKQEIRNLKDLHAAELGQLKDEHSYNIARIMEVHQAEIDQINVNYVPHQNNAVQDSPGRSLQDSSIIHERDNLQKVCIILKSLIGELTKYFIVCEEEINNTFITEILKGQFVDNVYSVNKDFGCTENTVLQANNQFFDTNNSILNVTELKMKRVHFAPQLNELVSIINSDTLALQNIIDKDDSVLETLRKELHTCVHRLRTESAEILGVSSSAREDKSIALSNEVVWMTKINDDLKAKVTQTESLIISYQQESERQKMRILELERKLAFADNKKEIISEGYGEHDDVAAYDVTLQDFSQLQEKARRVLSNGGGDTAYLLQLIEELCTQSDKVMDDARREKEDLQQQILAADKQLRAIRRFLEEQASEREAERDESVKQIRCFQEQLKEREREKERDLRISSETSLSCEPSSDTSVLQATDIDVAVEALETQVREMSSLVSDTEAKRSEKEGELKAAIEKISVLRDIVSDLEQQLQLKMKREESLQLQIVQLDAVIADQTKNQQELAHELDLVKIEMEDKQMAEHINVLQEELRKHKISAEHFNANSPVLKQMKTEIREMQNLLDKRISELEAVHLCGSNLSISQPSEDVSIREQIDAARCITPDDPTAPPMLPLDHILKLKQKMLKQVRAEEVAFKKMKDLEMQLAALKDQNEDLLAEQEILQQRASEQLFQMEAMRGRLEQHKQSAPFAQRQATSRLELQLHEANVKVQGLERSLADKDLELRDMKNQLERTIQLLQEKEVEVANVIQANVNNVQKIQHHLEIVEEENKNLQSKVGVQERAQLELPQLIDSMLADKNEEIDHLKEQLSKKEKQLDVYSASPLHEAEIKELIKQTEPKNSARTLSDVLSIHSECEEFSEAVRAAPNSSQIPQSVSSLKLPTISMLSGNVSDVSSVPQIDPGRIMEQIPLLDLGSHSDVIASASSASLSTVDKNKYELTCVNNPSNIDTENINAFIETNNQRAQRLESQLNATRMELAVRTTALEKRQRELTSLEQRCKEVQSELNDATRAMTCEINFYKNLHELSKTSESKIKKDLEEAENTLKSKIEELEQYQSKMKINEKIIMELNAENVTLRDNVQEGKRDDSIQKYASLLQEKVNDLELLNSALLEKDVTIETLQTRNVEIENENKQLYKYKAKYQLCMQELVANQNEVHRLTEGLNNRDQIITRLEEMARRNSLTGSSSPSDEKDQEIHHLQEYIKEKDRVIRQMSDDSKSLHKALETIQGKMKESGNVVELRKKLKDERKINAELKNMIENLRKETKHLKGTGAQRSQDNVDIEDMVQRELNLSARLDQQIMNQFSQKTEKDVEDLKKLKDQLEVENNVLTYQVAEYEDRLLQIKTDLAEESKKVVKLDKQLSTERNVVRSLKMQVDKEHRSRLLEHNQEVEQIELLQAKLKSSLDSEEQLRNELSQLRQEYKNSEVQFSSMVEQMQSQKVDNVPRLTDLIEAEKKKFIALVEKYEKEQRKNIEMQNTLTELQAEKKRCGTQLEILLEEKEEIISRLALTEGVKDHLETNLRRTKDELKAREEECGWLRQKIKTTNEAEAKRQSQRISEQNELVGLRRQINNAREVMTDLETDMEQSKRELENATERELTLTRALDAAKAKEVELLEKLRLARNEEKEMKNTVADLQRDLRDFVNRELHIRKDTSDKHGNGVSRIYDELTTVRTEKDRLAVYVKSLESQLKQNHSIERTRIQSSKTVEKLQHFYGKYLRADSRQKALVYQKRYLLCVLKGYIVSEENTLSILAQLTQTQRSCTRMTHNRKNPKARFKSLTFVIISIHRMKWLILRWRTGKCIGADTLLGNVNQPSDVMRKPSSNHSPPVKDRTGTPSGLNGYTLEQYYHRLKNIQQTLGFAMVESSTSHTVTE